MVATWVASFMSLAGWITIATSRTTGATTMHAPATILRK